MWQRNLNFVNVYVFWSHSSLCPYLTCCSKGLFLFSLGLCVKFFLANRRPHNWQPIHQSFKLRVKMYPTGQFSSFTKQEFNTIPCYEYYRFRFFNLYLKMPFVMKNSSHKGCTKINIYCLWVTQYPMETPVMVTIVLGGEGQ